MQNNFDLVAFIMEHATVQNPEEYVWKQMSGPEGQENVNGWHGLNSSKQYWERRGPASEAESTIRDQLNLHQIRRGGAGKQKIKH